MLYAGQATDFSLSFLYKEYQKFLYKAGCKSLLFVGDKDATDSIRILQAQQNENTCFYALLS